jgi:hypothetical protein
MMESYNSQIASIQSQLNKLQKPSFNPYVHKITPVDGLSGAEAVLKEMPAGSSDIVAHKSENIAYLLARDDNNVPAPIQVMKYEFIEAQDDPTGYVTKKDFDEFKAELKAIVEGKDK